MTCVVVSLSFHCRFIVVHALLETEKTRASDKCCRFIVVSLSFHRSSIVVSSSSNRRLIVVLSSFMHCDERKTRASDIGCCYIVVRSSSYRHPIVVTSSSHRRSIVTSRPQFPLAETRVKALENRHYLLRHQLSSPIAA
jgi:hypothetical protein